MRRMQSAAALIALLLATPAMAWGQARAVSGQVTSNLDGQPVAGVSVRLKGALQATTTDASGQYRIEVAAGSSEILTFSHEEHDYVEVEIAGKTQLDVVLSSRMRYNQYGQKVERNPLDAEERGGTLVFEDKKQVYRFWYDIRVQLDGAMFMGDTPAKIGDGVAVRRARMGLKGQLTKEWYGELDLDFADSQVELKDAYLKYSNGPFFWQVGNFKEYFSMETNTTSRYLTFMERPVGTQVLTPSRHLGMAVGYDVAPGLLAFGGLHFGVVDGAEEVQLRKDNNESSGQNEGYSLTGKLVYQPWFNTEDAGMHFGVAGSYRTPKLYDQLNVKRFDVRTGSSINRKKFLDTDRIRGVDHYTYRGAEAAAFVRGVKLQGEYNAATVVRDTLPSASFEGFYIMGSKLLFGGRYNYDRANGEFTQPSRGRAWGDLELAARYEYLNLTDLDAGITGGAGQVFMVGLNYWVNNNVKFMANYGFADHDRYANARGRQPVGYDASGKPTSNPALLVEPSGKAGNDYRILSVRFEVNF